MISQIYKIIFESNEKLIIGQYELFITVKKFGKSTLDVKVGGHLLQLEDVIDVSECVSYPLLFLIENKVKNRCLFLGGSKAGIIDLSLLSITYIDLMNRDTAFLEFWDSRLMIVEENYYFVYEGGILAFDESLSLKNQVKKYWDDDIDFSMLR